MTNNEVVERFLSHKRGKSLNMRTDGVYLYSYATCMAEWHEGKLYINTSKYSRTTSKQTQGLPSPDRCKGYKCVFVDTQKAYGLISVWAYHDIHVEAKKRSDDMKKHKAYYDFLAQVKLYTSSHSFIWNEDTKNTVLSLKDTARKNNFRKQMARFNLIKEGIKKHYSNNGGAELNRRAIYRHSNEMKSGFAFSI